MVWLTQYIASVTASAMICGILLGVMKQGQLQGILRIICGIFLTICVLQPITEVSNWNIDNWVLPKLEEGEGAVSEGRHHAETAMEIFITQETQAYILDIAKELGLEILVRVELSREDPPIPIGVTINGHGTPYQKLCLEDRISQELNIPKENLQWIG